MKDSSLMGVFLSSFPPYATQVSMVNMISSTTSDTSKGKEITETPSLGHLEALYGAIQSASDAYVDDHHLV